MAEADPQDGAMRELAERTSELVIQKLMERGLPAPAPLVVEPDPPVVEPTEPVPVVDDAPKAESARERKQREWS